MTEKLCGIYSYRDIKNGYKIVYIGQSRDIYRRHRSHYHTNKRNQQLIDKIINCDPKRYALYIEELCKDFELNQLEQKYIAKYKPLYNKTKGGGHTTNHTGGKSKYTLWSSKKTYYISHVNQNRNRPFRMRYNGDFLGLCYFEEWFTIDKIYELIEWGLKKER